MKPPIQVWEFKTAPENLKVGSPDDADWIALVPPEYKDIYIGWLQSGSEFGCCEVRNYPHPDANYTREGWRVYIGYHS